MILLAVIAFALLIVWAIMMVNLPEKLVTRQRNHKYIALMCTILVLVGGLVAWMHRADNVWQGPKDTVGKYLINNELVGDIYQDPHGEYFILEKTWFNVVHPQERKYLDEVLIEEYLNISNKMSEGYIKSLVKENVR